MVKGNSWFKNPGVIVGIITSVGIFGAAIVKLAVYITLPDRVAAEEVKVKSVEDYIKEQQISQHLLEKLVQQNESKEEAIFSPDKKSIWNPKTGNWEPIKK